MSVLFYLIQVQISVLAEGVKSAWIGNKSPHLLQGKVGQIKAERLVLVERVSAQQANSLTCKSGSPRS